MKPATITITLALLLAACGGEEPATKTPPADPFEVTFTTLESSPLEELPNEGVISRTWTFTCEVCGSTMSCGDEHPTEETEVELIHTSPTAADCLHDWRPGTHRAHPRPLRDGTLILVRRGKAYGAFRLTNQTTTPERAEFDWWVRTDGGGRLDAKAPTVTSGWGVCDVEDDPGAKIVFGPFHVDWSGNTDGFGYVYYPVSSGEQASPGATRVCVTKAKGITGLDAADPKWHFQGSPVD